MSFERFAPWWNPQGNLPHQAFLCYAIDFQCPGLVRIEVNSFFTRSSECAGSVLELFSCEGKRLVAVASRTGKYPLQVDVSILQAYFQAEAMFPLGGGGMYLGNLPRLVGHDHEGVVFQGCFPVGSRHEAFDIGEITTEAAAQIEHVNTLVE